MLLLRDLIFAMDSGMNNYRLIGAFTCNSLIQTIKDNESNYKSILDRKVKEWYTSETPPKSGRMILNIWLEER